MTATGTSNPLDPDTEFRRLQVENHQQAERIASLEAERDEADRRAGAAEREMQASKDTIARLNSVRSKQKRDWGVDDNTSFDTVWNEALALKAQLPQAQKELTTQTNRAAAAKQQVTALTQRLDMTNRLNTDARNQLAQLSARQAAPVGTAPIKDRLLCALERAAAAETALRRLVDECENDKAPGWEDRMLDCIAVANALLAAPPPPEREPLTDEQIFAIAKDVFPGNAHELIHETSPDYARACGMEPGARWTCSEVRPGQTLALSRAIERKHGIGATNAR